MADTEIMSIVPAAGWYAVIGGKRKPLSVWASLRTYDPETDTQLYVVQGLLPIKGEVVSAEGQPGFKRYEMAGFDGRTRVQPGKATEWLKNNISEFADAAILRRAVQSRTAQVLLDALAARDLDDNWGDDDDDN